MTHSTLTLTLTNKIEHKDNETQYSDISIKYEFGT